MNARIRAMLLCVAAVTAVGSACVGTPADDEVGRGEYASVRTEGAGQVPFYAQFSRTEVYQDGDLAVVWFYRPPACIPETFNLLDFFDMGAFACGPPTTDGFNLFENGPGIDPVPYHVQLTGLGAVPVWFVELAELETAMADDSLTIGELEALPSLLEGAASRFHENLHPLGGANVGKLELTAAGDLLDGRRFNLQIMQRDAVGRGLLVHITFR